MEDIEAYRKKIDEIDKELTRLFEERMDVVLKVGEYKKANNLPVFNEKRENEVLEKNAGYLKNDEYKNSVKTFFNSLMNIAKDLEYEKMELNSKKNNLFDFSNVYSKNVLDNKVGFFGVKGSFTEEAMLNHFTNIKEAKSYDEFEDVFMALKNDEINYGIVPIENSSTGAISKVYDLLYKYNFYIVGEECVKIDENLVGIEGTKIEDIKEVYSHEQPFAQSTEFLKEHPQWKLIPFHSTSVSAKLVSDLKDKSKAAIASKRAAKMYNLHIIKEKINNVSENTTRFIVISKNFESNEECNKLSIVFSMEHKAGALYQLVRHLAENQINMMKIESRPMKTELWKYFLYVDFEGNICDEKVHRALKAISERSSYFRLLGGYKQSI